MSQIPACPICSERLTERLASADSSRDESAYSCPQCGSYRLTGKAEASLPHLLQVNQQGMLRLSHALHWMSRQQGPPLITSDLVEKYFRPAIRQAGFALTRIDDEPEAGLIDNRLLVKIRLARFLIADLTHGNQGAYWEAGFAEGLGKPVIYTCRKDVFDDPKTKPHFDTNHHQTVLWEDSNPEKAAENLKATIRNTLPGEAVMEDPPA